MALGDLSLEGYAALVDQITSLMAIVRDMPLEAALEMIELTESQKEIHKPTEDQQKNMRDIKRAVTAVLELKKVSIDIKSSQSERKIRRIVLPGAKGWQ